jgi:hypothetical protein
MTSMPYCFHAFTHPTYIIIAGNFHMVQNFVFFVDRSGAVKI